MTLYLLAHPDAVKQVLQDNAANYPRPPFVRDRLQAIVGGGLVGAEGAGWVRSRRMAQPAFRRHQLEGYGAQFVEATTELLDSVLYPLIAERRRSPGGEDLVSMLVDVTDEETGAHLTDKQVRDETISFFIAGHATIASALTWTWYLLSTHPECWRRLRAEVDEVLDGRPPAVADLPRLAYTTMVVQEAMRLYPPIYLVLRRALADDEVGGYRLPAGANIALCPSPRPHADAGRPGRVTPERRSGIQGWGSRGRASPGSRGLRRSGGRRATAR